MTRMKVVTYISPMFLKTQIKNIGRVRNGRGVGEGRGREGGGKGSRRGGEEQWEWENRGRRRRMNVFEEDFDEAVMSFSNNEPIIFRQGW